MNRPQNEKITKGGTMNPASCAVYLDPTPKIDYKTALDIHSKYWVGVNNKSFMKSASDDAREAYLICGDALAEALGLPQTVSQERRSQDAPT